MKSDIMKLKSGFNIVEKEYEPLKDTMTIIEFLGRIHRSEPLPQRVTVRGLDTLIFNAVDNEEMILFMRNLLRDGQGKGLIRPNTVVQFMVGGKIMKDMHTKLKIRNDYISLENLFSSQITRMAPDWIHAVK